MAGHSKWANTKHRKAAQDAKRGKIFTKIIRELVTAARLGGGFWGRILRAPGMFLQLLTTREPELDQVEVAVAALASAVGSTRRA